MTSKEELFLLVGFFSLSEQHLTLSIPAFKRNSSSSTTLYRQIPDLEIVEDRSVDPRIERFEPLPIGASDRRYRSVKSNVLRSSGDSFVVIDENLANDPLIYSNFSKYREGLKRILPTQFRVSPLVAYELALLTADEDLIKKMFVRAARSIGGFSSRLMKAWINEQPSEFCDTKIFHALEKVDFSKLRKASRFDTTPFSNFGFSENKLRYFATGQTLDALGLFDDAAVINPTLKALRPFTEFEKRNLGEDIAFLTIGDLEGDEWSSLKRYIKRFSSANVQIVIVTTDEDFVLATKRAVQLGLDRRTPDDGEVMFLILGSYLELAYLCRNFVSGAQMVESGILFYLTSAKADN